MCDLLGVSASGYYDWATGAPGDQALGEAWLTEKIKDPPGPTAVSTAPRGFTVRLAIHSTLGASGSKRRC